MISFKRFVVAITLIAVVHAESAEEEERRGCTKMFRCSNVEDVVWATDGETCSVFRNGCHFANANCQRENNSEEELEEVSKSECQANCPLFCNMMYDPVCGDYNGVRRTFSNECVMSTHICESGETYTVFKHDECEVEDENDESNESDDHVINVKVL